MTGVPKVFTRAIEWPINQFTKTGFADKICKNYQSNNARFIGMLGISSIALKDGLGCYMYVKQSLNNKKIPEDKRKFVAALDLTNGGLMIAAQVLMFLTISNKKVQAKIFDKLFGKHFDKAAKAAYEVAIKNKEAFKDVTGTMFSATFEKFKKEVQGFFGIFTSLVASTIIAKRVIVPFIATPLADKAKGLLYKDEKKGKVEDKDTFTHQK